MYTTARVLDALEALDLASQAHAPLIGYMAAARGFLLDARRLAGRRSPTSRREAIIAAFHGAEFFTYELCDQVGVEVYRNANETIGLRTALGNFTAELKDRDPYGKKGITQQNDLSRMASLRDQIVHKAIDVSQADTIQAVEAASAYTSEWSVRVFGFDVLAT